MKAEDFVRQKYPKAYVESQKTRGFNGCRYYFVYSERKIDEKFRLSEGKSASNAWVNAKKYILRK